MNQAFQQREMSNSSHSPMLHQQLMVQDNNLWDRERAFLPANRFVFILKKKVI